MARSRFVFLLLATTIALDQFTKMLARDYFRSSPPVHFLGDIVTLLHSENPGAFLSLGAGMGESMRFWVFTVGVALFLLGAVVYLLRSKTLDRGSLIALSLMIGGGIGNLVDRALQGSVTDFMHLGLGPFQTGVFNVADMAISGGTLFLLFSSFKKNNTLNQPRSTS